MAAVEMFMSEKKWEGLRGIIQLLSGAKADVPNRLEKSVGAVQYAKKSEAGAEGFSYTGSVVEIGKKTWPSS
jgi:hypothetical protein